MDVNKLSGTKTMYILPSMSAYPHSHQSERWDVQCATIGVDRATKLGRYHEAKPTQMVWPRNPYGQEWRNTIYCQESDVLVLSWIGTATTCWCEKTMARHNHGWFGEVQDKELEETNKGSRHLARNHQPTHAGTTPVTNLMGIVQQVKQRAQIDEQRHSFHSHLGSQNLFRKATTTPTPVPTARDISSHKVLQNTSKPARSSGVARTESQMVSKLNRLLKKRTGQWYSAQWRSSPKPNPRGLKVVVGQSK